MFDKILKIGDVWMIILNIHYDYDIISLKIWKEAFITMLQILKLISKYIQTPQSLKEAPETALTFPEKETAEKRILEIYEEYQRFMSVNDMPRYKIHFKKKSVETLELASIEYEGEIYNLYISDVAYNSTNIKGILFHEFTHIVERFECYSRYLES